MVTHKADIDAIEVLNGVFRNVMQHLNKRLKLENETLK